MSYDSNMRDNLPKNDKKMTKNENDQEVRKEYFHHLSFVDRNWVFNSLKVFNEGLIPEL